MRHSLTSPLYALLALTMTGCQCRNGEPTPTADVDGVFDIVSEGSGPTNEAVLMPLHSGTVFAHRHTVVRAPVALPDGTEAYRYIGQPASAYADYPGSRNEGWLVHDDDGVWLMGDTQEGMAEHPFLLVPDTVREGMRWRTGGGDRVRTYEVLSRTEIDGELGTVTAWLITRDDDRPAYFLYGEGWGQITATFDTPPEIEVPYVLQPIRVVDGAPEPAQPTGPLLALEQVGPGDGSLVGSITRVDTLRAIRHQGETVLDLEGLGSVFSNGGYDLVLRHGLVTASDGGFTAGGALPGSRLAPNINPIAPYYEFGGSGDTVETFLGSAYHLGDEVFWVPEELLLWENELGGLNGAYPTALSGQTDLPLVEPTFGTVGTYRGNTALPIFGGFAGAPLNYPPGRTLLAANDTPSDIPFAALVGSTSSLVSSRMVDYADGRRIQPFTFVEAFPDLLYRTNTSPNQDFRGPSVHTTSSATEQVHLFTTPGGVIDRIEVDAQGARRVRLGQVDLPAGHSLQAAAQIDDDTLLVFTYARLPEFGGPATLSWTAQLQGSPTPVTPAPFVSIEWTGWDARVCWPGASDAQLDPSTWRLGPAPAADVLAMDGDCVLVIRDFASGPLPTVALWGEWPVGWRRVEGEIPGVGHLKAVEPKGQGTVLDSQGPQATGDVRPDGGAEAGFVTGPGEGYAVAYDAWGVNAGGPEGAFIPDLGGSGGWAVRPVYQRPEEHCGQGCSLDGFWSFLFVGPTPAVFQLRALPGQGTGGIPARGGGLLIHGGVSWIEETEHRGFMVLHSDGSIDEITTPPGFDDISITMATAYASGSFCAIDQGPTQTTLFCADFDGTLTSSAPMGTATPFGGPHGGWLMLDDTTVLASTGPAGTGDVVRIDLTTLSVLPYTAPDGVSPQGGAFHADGIYYTVDGAWLPTGFVPLDQIIDLTTVTSEADAAIDSFMVLGDVVVVQTGAATFRVPRDRWGITPCEPTTAPGLDADGDGFVAASSCGPDCDDADADTYPGAQDVCGDGVDADCDGDPDTGLTCWEDADGDGFAAEGALTMSACVCPAGWTDLEPIGTDIDCADQDANAYPGQTGFFDVPVVGAAADVYFDFDCDGQVTELYSYGACGTWPDCETTPGLVGYTPCGTAGMYMGCLQPDQCGRECTVDVAGFCGYSDASQLLVTQECR